MRLAKQAVLLVCVCASMPVYAANWYAGFGVGAGRSRDAASNVQNGITTLAGLGISSSATFNTGRAAFNIFGGYQFNRYVAAEIGWIDFGNYNLNGTAVSGGTSVAVSETDKISAFTLAAVGTIPINQTFSVFGKAGIAVSQDKESCTISGSTCASASDSATKPMFGIGGEMNASQNVGLRLEYDQYNNIGNSNNEYTAGDFYQVALSGLYRF